MSIILLSVLALLLAYSTNVFVAVEHACFIVAALVTAIVGTSCYGD